MTPLFSPSEIASAAPPSNLSSAEWAELYRELSLATSANAGRYTLAMVPFFRPILDAIDARDVEIVVIQKPSQIGATEFMVSWLGRVAAEDPGPAMVVLADEDTAVEICERRIQPMMRSSAPLRDLIIPAKMNQGQIDLKNSFSLTMAWSSSIARTASRPIRYLILDEITKPGYSQVGAEGAVIERCMERCETFANAKVVMGSSPTVQGDNLDQQMATCDEVREWCVPCPLCGMFQPLRFQPTKVMVDGVETLTGFLTWDNDQKTAAAKAETARYQCGGCKGLWTTAQKNAAVAHGRSAPRIPSAHKPRKVGFHLNRILSLFPGGRLESLVSDFLAAKEDPLKLQIFVNNSLGEHWTSYVGKNVDDNDVLRCRVDLPPRTVPAEAVCLVAGIDTQKSGFWFRVRAFARDTTSWGVDHGYLQTWEDLEALLYSRRYPIAGTDKTAGIWRALIDTGGTKHDGDSMSRTEEVYHWIRRNYGRQPCRVFPSKGSSTPMQGLVKLGAPLEKTPSGKSLSGAPIQIVSVDTDKAKDGLWWRMGLVGTSEPGAAYLHAETGTDYARQITAERKRTNRKGEIEWVRLRPDNHFLDCEGLCFAAVDPGLLGGILALPRPKKADPEGEKPKPKPERDDGDDFWTRGTSGGY